jgi:Flp pilus assembly protein TadB
LRRPVHRGAMRTPPKPGLQPIVALFIKLTAIVAAVILLLFIAGYLLKVVVIAAVIAAVLLGGYFIFNLIRRRSNYPVIR